MAGLVRGGVGCVTWHAGDIVDAGDVAVWLLDWLVRMEKEAVSQFVMCLALDQCFKRAHA